MWNFDKIQHKIQLAQARYSCGLMWNFDKIQRSFTNVGYSCVVV